MSREDDDMGARGVFPERIRVVIPEEIDTLWGRYSATAKDRQQDQASSENLEEAKL